MAELYKTSRYDRASMVYFLITSDSLVFSLLKETNKTHQALMFFRGNRLIGSITAVTAEVVLKEDQEAGFRLSACV